MLENRDLNELALPSQGVRDQAIAPSQGRVVNGKRCVDIMFVGQISSGHSWLAPEVGPVLPGGRYRRAPRCPKAEPIGRPVWVTSTTAIESGPQRVSIGTDGRAHLPTNAASWRLPFLSAGSGVPRSVTVIECAGARSSLQVFITLAGSCAGDLLFRHILVNV